MDSNLEDLKVVDNPAAGRFEARLDGHLAVIEYYNAPGQIIFTHTGVPKAIAGRGVGSKMARTVLEYARSVGLKVVPRCPFVAGYIKSHPEYQDLVFEDH